MKFAYASGARPLEGYTIKRGIGVGGFGEVYFATSDAGKEVALKRIQRNLEVELRGVRHCLNLKHVNLISIFDIKYDDEGEAWVVMEYISGESLKDVIDRNPNGMPHGEVDSWFQAVAEGVAYLHDHGIVHRDLKPGNIFIDEGVVKIGDYGLSKFISCSRRSGQTESVGTLHYMAPEIGKGVYGKEIDIYALGIILHEMLTGRVPFEGESGQEIVMKHLTADPDLSGIAMPYRSVIRRALLKDPAQRFAGVPDMLAALKTNEDVLTIDEGPSPREVPVAPELVQPKRIPPVVKPPRQETLFITDEQADPDEQEMVFGPVKQVTPPYAVSARGASSGLPATGARPTSQPASAGRQSLASGQRIGPWWHNSQLATPLKMLLLFTAIILLIMKPQYLVPLVLLVAALYLLVFGVRSLVSALGGSRSEPARSSARPIAGSPASRERHWQARAREVCRKKPLGERMAELTGSLLAAAFVCTVFSALGMVLAGYGLTSVAHWSLFAWLAVTSTAGAWTLLLAGKFWEGSEGTRLVRRLLVLGIALALGATAFGSSQFLNVPLDYTSHTMTFDPVSSPYPEASWYQSDGTPRLPAFLAYFAGIFVLFRWWNQVDPLRRTRLSLWVTGLCMIWAWVLHMIVFFPQPWGLLLAGTMTIAAQLAAPWMTHQQRRQIRQQYLEVG